MTTGKLAGAVVLIQQHGRPVYLKSFGVRDVATKLPMTPDTIFAIHSMTKPITSLAAMMLIDEGKLSLADPLSRYIPEYAGVKVGVASGDRHAGPGTGAPKRPVTIEDLLRHTSGISYDYIGSDLIMMAYRDGDIFEVISPTRISPSALRACHWRDSPARCGATAIPPTCSGA